MPPKRLPEPPGGTFDQAGPSQPRRRGERRARYRAPDILVDVTFHAIADVGSIPTVSTDTTRTDDRDTPANPAHWSGICCDKGDIVCRRFAANAAIRVADESRIGGESQSQASRSVVVRWIWDTLAFVDDCESANSRGRDARWSSIASASAGPSRAAAYA